MNNARKSNKQEEKSAFVSISELVGKLPRPLPQSYRGLLYWIKKRPGAFTVITEGKGVGKRYMIRRDAMEEYVEDYLGVKVKF